MIWQALAESMRHLFDGAFVLFHLLLIPASVSGPLVFAWFQPHAQSRKEQLMGDLHDREPFLDSPAGFH